MSIAHMGDFLSDIIFKFDIFPGENSEKQDIKRNKNYVRNSDKNVIMGNSIKQSRKQNT